MTENKARYHIRINGERLWLDADALANGDVASWDGASEQCEDCSADICESGRIITHRGGERSVRCGKCRLLYGIIDLDPGRI